MIATELSMTAAELIAVLQKMPAHDPVLIYDGKECRAITTVEREHRWIAIDAPTAASPDEIIEARG